MGRRRKPASGSETDADPHVKEKTRSGSHEALAPSKTLANGIDSDAPPRGPGACRERSRVHITDRFASTVERHFVSRGQRLDKPQEVHDAVFIGLVLRREPTGRKSWHYSYGLHGRRGRVKLGEFPAVSVKRARQLLRAAAEQVALGIDPVVAKREAHRKSGVSTSQKTLPPESIEDPEE
jgi:hypothetical protein